MSLAPGTRIAADEIGARPWIMRQSWYNLLFAHWPIPARVMAERVPAGLDLDTWDGEAWIGVVPFGMRGVRLRFTPAVPGLSRFLELNVRTYVTAGGKPGVYFFSLDAASAPGVALGRAWYKLPYHRARMSMREAGGWIEYRSRRSRPPAEFRGRYRPIGDVFHAAGGTLEDWLTARYCLYTASRGRLWRGDIHHAPWPLQSAEAEIEVNTMAAAHGFVLPESKPLLHFAKRLDVVAWKLAKLKAAATSTMS